MTHLAHIADMVLNRPLLIMPEKLAVIAQILDGRIGIDASRLEIGLRSGIDFDALSQQPGASRFAGSRNDAGQGVLPYMRTPEGVAILTVTGSLVNRGAWVGASSGLTSYEGIKYQAARIAADPKVKSVILDLDSPGGEAIGAFETATAIRALDAKKPVVAVVNGMSCSAAYALASGARRIVSTPTGVSGSIGVVLLHADYSGALDKAGVKPTFIFAGAHKVDGNPCEPLSKAVKSSLQAEVDAFYDLFVATVAQGRKDLTADKIRKTEARAFIGADAKAAGLVDEIGTLEDVLSGKIFSSSYFAAVAPTAHSASGVGFPATFSAAAPSFGTLGPEASAQLQIKLDALLAEDAPAAGAAAPAAPVPALDSAATWRGVADKLNAELSGQKHHARLPVPNQKGAVSYSDLADVLNAEAAGRKHHVRLPVPNQPGAASWSDIADKLNAELARTKPALGDTAARKSAAALSIDQTAAPSQKGAVGWGSIANKLNAEHGVNPPHKG